MLNGADTRARYGVRLAVASLLALEKGLARRGHHERSRFTRCLHLLEASCRFRPCVLPLGLVGGSRAGSVSPSLTLTGESNHLDHSLD